MLKFLKKVLLRVLSWLLSIVVLYALLVLLFVWLTREPQVTLEEGTVLVLDLNVSLNDSPSQVDVSAWLQEVLEGGTRTITVRETVRLLHDAATDPYISCLVLKGSLITENYGSGLPAIIEVGRAITRFRESGKKVYAWLEVPDMRDYLLATYADEIHMSPSGILPWNGLSVQGFFIAEFLQRNGIRVHVYQAGKYKGAADTFERQDFSPELREQWQRILQEQWQVIVQSVAKARGISETSLMEISQQTGILDADAALATGMVDHVSYFDQFLDTLYEAHDGDMGQVSMEEYAMIREDATSKPEAQGDSIAVVYIEGDIVAGESLHPMRGGDTYSREIRALREDPAVKAVVIRVNSPGGVAYAGEQIAREIALTSQVKPVIASLGTYAASAGYMVVAPAWEIVVEETTLTGSIGAFMLFPDLEQVATEYGVRTEQVATGPFADILSVMKSPSVQERAILERLLHSLYGEFLEIVMRGRDLSAEAMSVLAEGRIWTGAEAVHNGLADHLGGLEEAIRLAREHCGDSRMQLPIVEFPSEMSDEDLWAQLLSGPSWAEPLAQQDLRYLKKWLPDFAKSQTSLMRLLRSHQKQTVYSRLPFWLED